MRGYRAVCCLVTSFAILASLPFGVSKAADVKSARVWAGPDYTRLVLDLSGPVTYKIDQDSGQVKIRGEVWTARSYDDDDVFEPGARVQVIKIDGATALVHE